MVTGTVLSLREMNLTEANGEDVGGREGTGFKHGCSASDAMMPLTAYVYRDIIGPDVTSLWKTLKSICLSVCPIFAFTVFIPTPIPWTRNAGTHMCNLRRESATRRNAEMTASDAPYVTLLGPGGRERKETIPYTIISAVGTFRGKMVRGEVDYAITNYYLQVFFPRFTHSQAVPSVYTAWVCGVPFSSLFGSSYARDNVTGTVPPASPNRLQYKYVGIRSHLQHDAGPNRRNASCSVVIPDALAQWCGTWSPFSTPRDVLVSCFSHHLCLMALTALYSVYGSGLQC